MLILKDLLDRYQQLSSEPLLEVVSDYYLYDEKEYVEQITTFAHVEPEIEQSIEQLTHTLISVASENKSIPLINQVLSEYQLDQKEGVQLLALAEGLLRIKSHDTAQRFIQDKIVSGNWEAHKHKSEHTKVNLATEGLSLLKHWLTSTPTEPTSNNIPFNYWLNSGKSFLAQETLKLLISKLAGIFIKGASIDSALSKPTSNTEHCCSFDMLGEAALTEEDADQYLDNYLSAILAIAHHQDSQRPKSEELPGCSPEHSISIKLSALTPKFQYRYQTNNPCERFITRIEKLVRTAHEQSVAVTLDAEESDQLEMTLEVFKHLFLLPGLKGWGNLGIAIQAYGFRAVPSILFLSELAKEHETVIPVRLVKGAYWDTEIHKAQELGLDGYPVFTQKAASDLNYQACVKIMLELQQQGLIKSQFASHNAMTIATVITLAESIDPEQTSLFPIEFQRLHGMGEHIYSALSGYKKPLQDYYCRSYCPVGPYQELLPYLIRRILENGSNQSFLNAMSNPPTRTTEPNDEDEATEENPVLYKLPHHSLLQYDRFRQTFPSPKDIYLPWLEGSFGFNINHFSHIHALQKNCEPFFDKLYDVKPALPENIHHIETTETLFSPNELSHRLGLSYSLTQLDQMALNKALKAPCSMAKYAPEKRIHIIRSFAQSMENNKFELIALCIQEAGKTWQDAISEIKEAIDFCHYYANQYEQIKDPITLPHTANEFNQLRYRPKGNFLCISPWNFPIAILVGQVVAALVTGNRVIIKPAPQTRICGRLVFDLMRNCGVPGDSLYFLPTNNETSHQLVSNKGIDGIAFTGSLQTARNIQQALLESRSYPIPFIAETSGMNCMITDDSILTEQMVKDVVASAFGSAGQRCSALRVLFLHESIYDDSVNAIKGVMDHLIIGTPKQLSTDLGPIIDAAALSKLEEYIQQKAEDQQLIHQLPTQESDGYYFAPTLVALDHLDQLKGEHFGPILHVIKYQSSEIEQLINDIESSSFALTLGIHSRDQHWVDYLCSKLSMGNIYINRHITGAQVAAQPFGGHKRSGTGFKAGGPNYLLQFINEQCISENIAAIGGNTSLITQSIK